MLYNAAVSFINNAQQFATEKKWEKEFLLLSWRMMSFPQQLNNSDSYITQNLLSN